MPAPKGTVLPYVKAWRERRWLTQEGLRQRARLSLATIQQAERGKCVSLNTVNALAKALDVTPDQLAYEAPETARVAVSV